MNRILHYPVQNGSITVLYNGVNISLENKIVNCTKLEAPQNLVGLLTYLTSLT